MFAFLISSCLVACCLFIFGLNLDLFWLRLACKPIPQLMILYWIVKYYPSKYTNRIALGLVLCIIADLFLEFRQATFIYGIAFFLLGHIAYISAFIQKNKSLHLSLFFPFAAWSGTIFFLIEEGLGKLYFPVAAYTIIICLMMWRASALINMNNFNLKSMAPLFGAVLFAFGDTLIAFDRFYEPIQNVRYPIILSYWPAQFLIAYSAKYFVMNTGQANSLEMNKSASA